MRKMRGLWYPNKSGVNKWLKVLTDKGYTVSESRDIITMRLSEYNPLGKSMDRMINETIGR